MVVAAATQTVLVAGDSVDTTVTALPAVVRRWVHSARWLLSRRRHRTVGLGVQWTPLFRAGADERPATLQLCTGKKCLVFHIARGGGRRCVPMILRRFMADGSVTFAGYNVAADCRKLRDHHGMHVAAPMELRRGGHASMEEMADRLLGIRGVAKSRKIAVGKWDGTTLSKKQVRYACVDAYLSYRLGVRLWQQQ